MSQTTLWRTAKSEAPIDERLLQRALEDLKASGPGPFLTLIKDREPVLQAYVTNGICEIWNILEALPIAEESRETLKGQTIALPLVIAAVLMKMCRAEAGAVSTPRPN